MRHGSYCARAQYDPKPLLRYSYKLTLLFESYDNWPYIQEDHIARMGNMILNQHNCSSL